MLVNKETKTILIENPLTGNSTLISGLNLERPKGSKKWMYASEAREIFKRGWKSYKKIVLVRDPVARFESAATLLVSSDDKELKELGVSEDFIKKYLKGIRAEETPQLRALAILKALDKCSEDDQPRILQPQDRWLVSAFDLILCTKDIAEYFNRVVKKSAQRTNPIATHRDNLWVQLGIGEESQKLFAKIYAKDKKRFETMLVWTFDKQRIRLVAGNCASSEAKVRREGKDPLELNTAN